MLVFVCFGLETCQFVTKTHEESSELLPWKWEVASLFKNSGFFKMSTQWFSKIGELQQMFKDGIETLQNPRDVTIFMLFTQGVG